MTCPYCAKAIHPADPDGPFGRGTGSHRMWYSDPKGQHSVRVALCPSCRGVFLLHDDIERRPTDVPGEVSAITTNEFVLLPRVSARPHVDATVPEPYARLYNEAALIVTDSPRASAMLTRRCLQHLLREEAHVPDLPNLYKEIEWTIEHAGLPDYITDSLHEPRVVGNMGAHPTKSGEGEYIEVKAGEAEWMLDVLDSLFEFYFIAKARAAARKAELAKRLGK